MGRRLLLGLHLALLGTGAAMCIWAIVVTLQSHGLEPGAFALRRWIPAVLLLLLVVTYALFLWRKGFRPLSIPAFISSFLALGLVVSSLVSIWAKGFAPAPAFEQAAGRVQAVGYLAATVAATVVLAWYVHRTPRT